MRFIFNIKTYIFAVLVLLCACSGEDRSHEYRALTEHNYWVYDAMLDYYLWADTLQEPQAKKFFGDPSTFLTNVKSKVKEDKWSFLTVDTITSDPYERGYFNHNESYGMDYMLVTDPTGQTTKQYVRVITIYDNSKAQTAGLQRGDYITSYNDYKFSSKNVDKLKKGEERKLTVSHLGANAEDNTYYWKDTVNYVLDASRLDGVPYSVKDEVPNNLNIIETYGKRVGYYLPTNMMLEKSEMAPGDVFKYMKEQTVNEFVLDLRLCNYGDIEVAQQFASAIVSSQYLNSVFANTVWNKYHSDQNKEYIYDASVTNLGLSRVFIITSGYTQGPAEWLIHSLQATMGTENVILIGTKTAGQNVMTKNIYSSEHLIDLNLAVAFVADSNGNYEYSSGIQPTYNINEFEYVNLAPYGDENEVLLMKALELMKTLPCPSISGQGIDTLLMN